MAGLVCGVGINVGKGLKAHKGSKNYNELNERIYITWRSMICRCYSNEYHGRESYKKCEVCEEWKTLSNFVRDISEIHNYDLWVNDRSYQLDKDIIGDGHIYSLSTCLFVTKKENVGYRNASLGNKFEAKNIETGETIVFNSSTQASKCGFNRSIIMNILNGKRENPYNGFEFKRV